MKGKVQPLAVFFVFASIFIIAEIGAQSVETYSTQEQVTYPLTLQGSTFPFTYYGTLYVGSALQPLKFLFDTKASHTWIATSDCSASHCSSSNVLAKASSSSYSQSSTTESQGFGDMDTVVQGPLASDQICLFANTTFCTEASFSFIGVNLVEDMTIPVQYGVVGLSPQGTSQFVASLASYSKAVPFKFFTIHLFSQHAKSYIEFGRPDDENSYYTYGLNSYAWAQLYDDPNYWGCVLQSHNLGSSLVSKGLIFDSLSEYDYVPPDDLTLLSNFFNSHNSNLACSVISYQIVCSCDLTQALSDMLPQIELTIGSNSEIVKLTYVGSEYMKRTDSNPANGNTECRALFQSGLRYSQMNYWILGMPTYRSFEISHDYESMRLGFKPMGLSKVLVVNGSRLLGGSLFLMIGIFSVL